MVPCKFLPVYMDMNISKICPRFNWSPNLQVLYIRNPGWGILRHFPPFRYFPTFSEWSNHWLHAWYHVHVWQVSPLLRFEDTWQIWTWLKVSNLYFSKSKFPATEKLTNGALVTPSQFFVITVPVNILYCQFLNRSKIPYHIWWTVNVTRNERRYLAKYRGTLSVQNGQNW